jgi:hypothetical protein
LIGLVALLAALQAEPQLPPCSDDHPVHPCVEPAPVVHLPADAIGLAPLSASGTDGVRTTMTSSLGGPATLVQVTAGRGGRARLFAAWFTGHPYSGWRELDRVEIAVPMRAYRQLADRIDSALARPDGCPRDEIYLDGPMYRTERYFERRTERTAGGLCFSHGSGTAFSLAEAFVCQHADRAALPASFREGCADRISFARDVIRRRHLDR